MNLFREFIKDVINPDRKILISPPPKLEDRVKELFVIMKQKQNPINPIDSQYFLDKKVSKLFDAIIKNAGYDSHKYLIKKLKSEIKPAIKFHKSFFNAIRPNELANYVGLDFNYDYLSSAQTPSYPSGHTTQAFYLAHKLSSIFPDLKKSFYKLADLVAQSRVDRGIHFPSDNHAGKILAAKLAKLNLSEANEYGWDVSSKKKMFLDKNGIDAKNKKEQEEYLKSMVMMESRFKQMSKSKFTRLKQALANSSFLDADPEGDLDNDDWSSEAALVLRDTINDYFDSSFGLGEINTIVKVDMMPTDINAGKDAVLKGASYYYDGFHNVELILANLVDGPTFKDIPGAHQKVYEVVMHELLHMQQFMKFSRGNPTMEKWNQFKKSYESAGGSHGMGPDYFFFDDPNGPSEMETFSFQMANELVDAIGKDQAVAVLQKQQPDKDIIRNNSASFRDIESKSSINRKEFRDMLKRAKQYAKRM